MALSTQIFLYNVDTAIFYSDKEREIYDENLTLYGSNDCIAKKRLTENKKRLTAILDEHNTPIRELNNAVLGKKNIVALFESALTRALKLKTNELTTDIIIVNVYFFQVFEDIVKNGFLWNGEKYVFLSASAGQIRTKKAVFIKETAYERIKLKLMCGLTAERINNAGGINCNKFNAYLALNNSATDVWADFDIDKSIVVPDFETAVKGVVDFVEQSTYNISRQEKDVVIQHTDGAGMMLHGATRMVRLPWIKGLLIQFPFDEFIKENCVNGDVCVKDIYGKGHWIIKEGIEYIFTESQFKAHKYYSSWEEYKALFKKYECEACYCNIEEERIPNSRINYQMLQTLTDMTEEEINKITKATIKEINSIGYDFGVTMRILGADDFNDQKNYFQQGVNLYPELLKDGYHKEILKQTKKSYVKQAKAGRLKVNGKYLFIAPDLYAFCERLFLGIENPNGLLDNGEVFCNIYPDKAELACMRSPHLYREWAIRTNTKTEKALKWFGNTKCLYTSTKDLISKILQFDNDGDKSLVINDKTLIEIAKRNMRDIVPLAYDLKKAVGEELNLTNIYNGMCLAFVGGNIGIVSNKITKIWNSGNITAEELDLIKCLCYQNNQVIDYAKTLWLDKMPKAVENKIKEHTRKLLPYFFIFAKDKADKQVERPNNSTMNRISAKIPTSKIKYCKAIGKLDCRMLMNAEYGCVVDKNNAIISTYDYWQGKQYLYAKVEDRFKYQEIRKNILNDLADFSVDFIVNSLVMYLYTYRKGSMKKILWECFGDVIVENLKKNTAELERVCPVCGRRLEKSRFNINKKIFCSNKCKDEFYYSF